MQTNSKGVPFSVSGIRVLGYDAYKPSKTILTIKYYDPTSFQYLLFNEMNNFEQELTEEQAQAMITYAQEQHYQAEQNKIAESQRLQKQWEYYQQAG